MYCFKAIFAVSGGVYGFRILGLVFDSNPDPTSRLFVTHFLREKPAESGLRSDEELETICHAPYEEQTTKWTQELRDGYFNALAAFTEVVNVAFEKTVGCEFKAYLEAIKDADTVVVYDPDDPLYEREAAAAAVTELLNRQVLTLDPRAIRLL